jgi:hypothetical protein
VIAGNSAELKAVTLIMTNGPKRYKKKMNIYNPKKA